MNFNCREHRIHREIINKRDLRVRFISEIDAMKKSEAKFLGLLESAPDAIVIVDRRGSIVMINTQTEKMVGYSRSELLGKSVEILIPERYSKEHIRHRTEYTESPHTRPMGAGLELFCRRKDGSEFPVEISLSPLETEQGLLVTSIIRDISEHKRAEEDLKQARDELEKRVKERTAELLRANDSLMEQIAERKRAEEQIREQAALLDKTQDAILVRDLNNRILFWNKGAETLYGWSAAEATGINADDLLFGGYSSQIEDAKRIVFEKGEWSGELRQITKDGRDITTESRWTLVRDDKDAAKSILVINTDITERKKLAAQFLRAQRMESIGTLASGIAHDLNNSLTPILVAIELLRNKVSDDDGRLLLNTIAMSAERGAGMVKQVLSFARGVEGQRIVIQMRHLIGDMNKILNQTFPKSIAIETFVPKDLYAVSGDATHLYQVLMNLAVNARDAMPEGGKLSIRAENAVIDDNYSRMNLDSKEGQYILITVADTGKGIPSELLDKIFEPFFTTKEIGKGTGLGLSTAAGIVKSHGGFINVYSEISKGTEFKIYLPAVETPRMREARGKSAQLPMGHGELILVVDDEASIREIAAATLKAYHYEALTAEDGTEALALFAKNMESVKLVLLDMMMPYMNGPMTIRALQKLDPNVKIIASSGLMSNSDIDSKCVKAFLSKPYTAQRLLETVAEVLKNG